MAKRFKWTNVAGALASVAAGLILMTSLAPAGVSAGSTKPDCSPSAHTFFGLEPWYQYLNVTPKQNSDGDWYCDVTFPGGSGSANSDGLLGKNSAILLIVLAVIDDLLRVAGMVAVIFIIIGGFRFITAQGEPEAAAKARQSIIFSIVGLVIALIAVVIVSFIGNSIGH